LYSSKLIKKFEKYNQSAASIIPVSCRAKIASLSGKIGESYILQTLYSALPFLRYNLVVLAWAKIFPPTGFLVSAKAIADPAGSLIT